MGALLFQDRGPQTVSLNIGKVLCPEFPFPSPPTPGLDFFGPRRVDTVNQST